MRAFVLRLCTSLFGISAATEATDDCFASTAHSRHPTDCFFFPLSREIRGDGDDHSVNFFFFFSPSPYHSSRIKVCGSRPAHAPALEEWASRSPSPHNASTALAASNGS